MDFTTSRISPKIFDNIVPNLLCTLCCSSCLKSGGIAMWAAVTLLLSPTLLATRWSCSHCHSISKTSRPYGVCFLANCCFTECFNFQPCWSQICLHSFQGCQNVLIFLLLFLSTCISWTLYCTLLFSVSADITRLMTIMRSWSATWGFWVSGLTFPRMVSSAKPAS